MRLDAGEEKGRGGGGGGDGGGGGGGDGISPMIMRRMRELGELPQRR
jgi:hypothetical protein